MSEENKNKSRGLFLAMAVAIAIPLLYVLSVGPAFAIAHKYPKSELAFRGLYYPVIWLDGHTVLQEPLDWYVGLWM